MNFTAFTKVTELAYIIYKNKHINYVIVKKINSLDFLRRLISEMKGGIKL